MTNCYVIIDPKLVSADGLAVATVGDGKHLVAELGMPVVLDSPIFVKRRPVEIMLPAGKSISKGAICLEHELDKVHAALREGKIAIAVMRPEVPEAR